MKYVYFGLVAILSLAAGFIGSWAWEEFKPVEYRIADFYLTENAVHVSPHSLRVKMAKGIDDFVLVDLRSKQEYQQEHVAGAVNIPAYSDPNTPAYQEIDRIVSEFKKLPSEKEVIVYCYSIPCMTGRKIGKMLVEKGIYVKVLGIGWNEWRYFWNLWNHEGEWNVTDVMQYVANGSEPGKANVTHVVNGACALGAITC